MVSTCCTDSILACGIIQRLVALCAVWPCLLEVS